MPRRAYWQNVLDRLEVALGWEPRRGVFTNEGRIQDIEDEIARLRRWTKETKSD